MRGPGWRRTARPQEPAHCPQLGPSLMRTLQTLAWVLVLGTRLASAAQTAGTLRLVGVNVVGSKRYDAAEIARATGLKIGENASIESVKAAADSLGSVGVFAQVSYRYTTRDMAMTVTFNVQDAAKLLPCTFENFVWFSPQELLHELRSRVPLFDGQVPEGGRMCDVVSEQLRAMLETRGIHAQVQAAPFGPIGGPAHAMQFREMGVPLPMRKIEFSGVAKVDAALLQEAARPLLKRIT